MALLISLSFPWRVAAQQLEYSIPYSQYTVADGLAQMQVRTIYADKEGLVWIGTQGGLSYFDGNTIHTIKDLGPLNQQYIVKVVRGSGKLFISTHNEIYTYENATIIKRVPAGQLPVNTYANFEDPLHHIWMLTPDYQAYILDEQYHIREITEIYPRLTNIRIRFAWGNPDWDNCYLVDDQNHFYVFNPVLKTLEIDSTTLDATDHLYAESNTSDDPNSIILKRINPQGVIGEKTSDIFRVVDDKLTLMATRTSEDERLRIVSDLAPSSYLERADQRNIIFIQRDGSYVQNVLPAFNSPRFKVESNRKIYIATDEGVIVVHGEGLQQVSFPACDYPWSVMPNEDGGFYLGCYKSGIFKFTGNGHLLRHYSLPASMPNPLPGDQILSNFLITKDALLWGSNGGFMALRNNSQQLELIQCGYSVEAIGEDHVTGNIVAGANKLLWFDPKMALRIDSLAIPDSILDGRSVNDLIVAPDRNIWVAAPKGILLLKQENKQLTYYTQGARNLPCVGAVTIAVDPKGTVWSGGTCGLMKRRPGEDRFSAVLPGIIKGRVNQVTFLPGERLACAANNLLYILDISHDQVQLITLYDESNGLHLHEPSENGSSVLDGRFLWLPSVEGIQRLDLTSVQHGFFPAALKATTLNGNDIDIIGIKADTLSIAQAAALIDISVIDYTAREWLIRYSLNQKDYSPWQSARQILVNGLKHGLNHLVIQASWNTDDTGAVVEESLYLKAKLPIFHRQNTQQILGLLSVIGIAGIALAIILVQRSRKRMLTLQADLQRNRLRTIQAYLNPHFLFNTLASIQDRVLQRDATTGNDIIIRLSRVFRKILDTERQESRDIPLIRLSEETGLIEDIVWLNNQQHSVPVQFELNVEHEARILDPLIPPLLIQPFVENAFKHAFGSSTDQSMIKVNIRLQESMLIAEIVDNGIGYDGIGTESTQATLGTPLARERMEILNKLGIENRITFQKLEPQGTKVIIQISLTK